VNNMSWKGKAILNLKNSIMPNDVEPYKTIPAWVCRNLVYYGNCYISERTLYKIGVCVLKEYHPSIKIIDYEGGKILKV